MCLVHMRPVHSLRASMSTSSIYGTGAVYTDRRALDAANAREMREKLFMMILSTRMREEGSTSESDEVEL